MDKNKWILLGLLGALIAALAIGAGSALAQTGGDDGGPDDGEGTPIAGADLERASQLALDYLGGGTVAGSELGDEEGYYEIEVTRADGSQVDVHLDESFNVLSEVPDGD